VPDRYFITSHCMRPVVGGLESLRASNLKPESHLLHSAQPGKIP
jgi:hypothetical protein